MHVKEAKNKRIEKKSQITPKSDPGALLLAFGREALHLLSLALCVHLNVHAHNRVHTTAHTPRGPTLYSGKAPALRPGGGLGLNPGSSLFAPSPWANHSGFAEPQSSPV